MGDTELARQRERAGWVSGTESQTIAFKLCVRRTGALEWRPLLPPAPQLGPYLTLPLKGGRHGAGSSLDYSGGRVRIRRHYLGCGG